MEMHAAHGRQQSSPRGLRRHGLSYRASVARLDSCDGIHHVRDDGRADNCERLVFSLSLIMGLALLTALGLVYPFITA